MSYAYTLTIGATTFTPSDMEKIVDSSTLKIVKPFCSTKKTSGTGTMSVIIKGAADPVFYQTFMVALLGAQMAQTTSDCEIVVTDTSSSLAVFRGYLELSTIQINSAKLPQNLTLSATDKSTLLDRKILLNQKWENEKRSKIISDLLEYLSDEQGASVTLLSDVLPTAKKIKRFAVAKGKEQTYREVIDKILLESAGYVLWYDPAYDGFRIVKIQTDLTGLTPRTVEYLVKNQLQTKSAIYEKDGVLLSFPNVVERPNTNIYTENISVSLDDENNVIGENIPYQHYFPSDGDIKEIYQEYRVPDRTYLSHESRLQNEDLKLIYCKDVTYSITSTPSLSLAPSIPSVDWDGTPQYYPDRARILFVNNNQPTYIPSEDTSALDAKDYYTYSGGNYVLVPSHDPTDNPKALGWYEAKGANLSAFSLTGTAVYEDYLNKVTVGKLDPDPITGYGSPCTNPEEYKADTIQYMNGDSDFSEAVDFAKWYYKSLNYGQTTSQWTELPGTAYLGEVVYVAHKMTGIMMPHIIVQITDESIDNSRVRMNRIVAISIYGWQEYVYDNGVSANGTGLGQNTQRANTITTGSVLTGTTTARGVAGIVGDTYLNDDPTSDSYGNMYKCIVAGTAITAVWEFRANLKGEDATIVGYVYEIEYKLSTSDSVFTLASGVTDWYKGLYVWSRIKITDPDGNVTYETPVYAKDMTESLYASCVFEILPTSAFYTVNHANTTGNGTYTASLAFTGYSSSDASNPITAVSVLNEDNTSTGISNVTWSGSTVSFDVAYDTTAKQIKISVTGRFGETASCYMNADDQTQYNPFGGVFPTVKDAVSTISDADALATTWFTSEYGGVIEGATYSLNISGQNLLALRTWLGNSWAFLSQSSFDKPRISEICGKAQQGVLSLVSAGSVTASDYGYFNIIVANIVTADYIGAKQIQIQEDAQGNPGYIYGFDHNDGSVTPSGTKGQRVSGKAFIIDSDGVSEFSESYTKNQYAENINMTGTLNMYRDYDTSTDDAGADILHPAFSTTPAIEGDPTGISILIPAASGITTYDPTVPASKVPTANSIIASGISGTFKGNSITKMASITNASVIAIAASSGSSGAITPTITQSTSFGIGYEATITFTVPSDTHNYPTKTISVTTDVSNSWSNTQLSGVIISGSATLTVNGTTIGSTSIAQSTDVPYSISVGGTASLGDTVMLKVQISEIAVGNIKSWDTMNVSWSTGSRSFSDVGMTTGLWLYSNSSWTNLGTSAITESTNRLVVSTPFYYNSQYFVLPSTLYNYSSYTVNGTTYNIELGRAYKAEGTLIIDGTSNIVLNTFVRTSSGVMFYTNNGEYFFERGEQYYISTQANIKILGSTRGIAMEGCYPKKNFNNNGGYDCGTSGLKWNYGWFNVCNANQFNDTSRAEDKENIETYEGNAIELLNKVDIVTYNYKDDPEKKWHIGFLADYTPWEIAGVKHDSMIVNHCVGMLIKAVQELSAKNKVLEEKIEKLTGGAV